MSNFNNIRNKRIIDLLKKETEDKIVFDFLSYILNNAVNKNKKTLEKEIDAYMDSIEIGED